MELPQILIIGSSLIEETNTCWSWAANMIYASFDTGIFVSES